MPAMDWEPSDFETGSTGIPQYVSVQGTNFPVPSYKFDAAADEYVYLFGVVRGWASGGTVKIRWYADTATSGNVVLAAQIACITPDTDSQDVETKAFATQQTVTDSHLGTTGQREHIASISLSSFLDSLADEDSIVLKVGRLGSNGSDTMTGDAHIRLISFEYS